ncbi:hypothetical protein KJ877_10810 [bacterium]|nr:hypothetical protein [bacterium]MBU1990982.1 hypothetical protein [bacterium]
MKLREVFLAVLIAVFIIGCGSNNSDAPVADPTAVIDTNGTTTQDENTTIPVVDTAPVASVILPKSSTTLTLNSEGVTINVSVIDEFNNPYADGNVKIIYPNDVREGRDVGSFTQLSVALTNGTASFDYTGPTKLDDNTSDIQFYFYHESNPEAGKTFTIHIVPVVDQVVLTNYTLNSSISDNNVSMGLNSNKLMSFFVYDDKNTELDDSSMTSMTVEMLNPSLATLEDINGTSGNTITVNNQNSITVNISSNTISGIVPLKVTAVFLDINNEVKTLTKIFNIVVLSGPPSAMSISYADTAHDTDNANFKERMIVSLTDEYGNQVDSQPALAVEMIAGYAADSSGPLGYMYHSSALSGVLDVDRFKVDEGAIGKINLTSSGSKYSLAPTVSLAGGDGTFSATAYLSEQGSITDVTMVNAGSAYTEAPVVTALGKGYGFVASTSLSATGSFKSISLDNPGNGFTSVPSITAVGGDGNFNAKVTLEATGGIKSISIDTAGTGCLIGDELTILGDGTDAVVKVLDVDGAGGIAELTILNKGSGYTYANIDTTVLSCSDARFTATIGYKIKEISLLNGGSNYASSTLSVSGGSPDENAIVSGELSYTVASVNILSGGYGYEPATTSIVFTGDGKDAYAVPTIKYPVEYIKIDNAGKGYSSSPLVITNAPADLTGSGASANAVVFSSFANVDEDNYKLALFGNGYVYNASGKWDFTHTNAVDDYELVMLDSYEGNLTSGLGFAIGNNHRQDSCIFGKEWVATAKVANGSVFDSNGIAEVEIDYVYYLMAKDIVLMANLVGVQNSIGTELRIGEAIKHTLRGSGLNAPTISFPKGVSYATYRFLIYINNTVEPLRNARFTYNLKVTGDDVVIHEVKSSMTNGISDCGVDSDGNKLEGRAYVDVTLSSATEAGTISLDDLEIVREFN